MTTAQDPPVRRRQKARRTKQLAAWREKNEGKPPSKAAVKRLAGDAAKKPAESKTAKAAAKAQAPAAAKPQPKAAAKPAASKSAPEAKKAAKTK
jgi:hypothetical protein